MSNNPNIVTSKIMASVALEFNIGADLLGKANHRVDAHLGSDEMSGDTVYVPINNTGEVFDDLDLTAPNTEGRLEAKRNQIAVSVSPLVTAGTVGYEDLTLSIKEPEIMGRRSAKMADEANRRAYQCILGGSQAYVAESATAAAYTQAAYDAEANTTTSGLSGTTYGIAHKLTCNRLAAALQTPFGANSDIGSKLYRNELGNMMGMTWTKGNSSPTVTAADTAVPSAITGMVSGDKTFSGTAPTTIDGMTTTAIPKGTYKSQPFTLAGVYNVTALGTKTNDLKTWTLSFTKTTAAGVAPAATDTWTFSTIPVYSHDAAGMNCYIVGISDDITKIDTTYAPTSITPILTAGKTYMSPILMYKKDDFLVALKGLASLPGTDSFTIPTLYRSKGILPLRGSCDSSILTGKTVFRIDVLLGMGLYTGLSCSSAWFPMS